MKLSQGEKLILLSLYEIKKHLEIRGEFDPEVMSEAISSGHMWVFDLLNELATEDTSDQVLKVTVDVLDMWSFIQNSYSRMGLAEREQLKQLTSREPKIPGFDGNNEIEYMSTAQMLLKMGRFSTFEKQYLNSHRQTIDRYQSMLRRFGPMRPTLTTGLMSAEQMAELLDA